ncbi:hypothetical protein K461DRAFT_320352 [Myriangium duriaei CBS 260.36]|uniref:BRCT domain-containing protein n=1 Tax=Myriangium duriaei CBS 260.36 TaxID=1168546 RepID=A0A9P4J6P4_9PEZI|nr:hypothetical protein K461DRAFT_320352 [Myriangium duriaei CBS 260.36]
MSTHLKGFVIAVVGYFEENRSAAQYRQWIETAGGRFANSLVSDLTHLVVAKNAWVSQPATVKEALERKDIGIVTQAWIDDALQSKRKVPKGIATEKNWRKQARASMKGKSKSENTSKSSLMPSTLGKRHRSKYAQALSDETAKYASTSKRQKPFSRTPSSRSDSPDPFTKSASTAKRYLLSSDHHHYTDETGFVYDLLLVKVFQAINQTQQLRLQIFESNAHPNTYATLSVMKDIRSGKELKNLLVPVGASFSTALRKFRIEFESRTGVKWEDRTTACRRAKPKASDAEGSTKIFIDPATLHAQGGARHNSSQKRLTDEQWEEFEKKFFIWRIPAEGEPQGAMVTLPPELEEADAGTFAGEMSSYQAVQGAESDQTNLSTIVAPDHPQRVAAAGSDVGCKSGGSRSQVEKPVNPFVEDASTPGNSPGPIATLPTPPGLDNVRASRRGVSGSVIDLTLADDMDIDGYGSGTYENGKINMEGNEDRSTETGGNISTAIELDDKDDQTSEARGRDTTLDMNEGENVAADEDGWETAEEGKDTDSNKCA